MKFKKSNKCKRKLRQVKESEQPHEFWKRSYLPSNKHTHKKKTYALSKNTKISDTGQQQSRKLSKFSSTIIRKKQKPFPALLPHNDQNHQGGID